MVLDIHSNVGGAAVAAVKKGSVWIGMEDDKKMRDATLDYVTNILAPEAMDLDWFAQFCTGIYEWCTSFTLW